MQIPVPGGVDHHKLYEVWTMARKYMDYYGLENWTLEFMRSVRDAGECSPEWMHTIKLSAPLMSVESMADSEDTVLHEIAHALVGAHHKHDAIWKAKAREIGATPEARYHEREGAGSLFRWTGACPADHKSYRQRPPRGLVSCGQCSGKFDLQHVITWKKNEDYVDK